jgi:hypothetical protein
VWLTCLTLGLLFDVLFWKQRQGINFAVYVVLCLIAGFLLLRLEGLQVAGKALWLVPLILLFAAISFVRAEPLTVFLGIFLSLFLLALLAVTFLGGGWLRYDLRDYAVRGLQLARSVVVRPLLFRGEVSGARAASGVQPSGRSVWPVLRGLLIALPVLVVFAALLASADLVFGRELSHLLALLRLDKLPEYVFRLMYVLLAAYSLAGVFLHAASQSREDQLVGQGRTSFSRILGFVEAVIVLAAVAMLFGAFVLVQFKYFFGGQTNINVEGFTYSEYARRGFGELMTVAFFCLLMILGLGTVTRRETSAQQRVFSGLSLIILALVSVMLVSAFERLSLYELAYGFSRLRTYVHVSLVWTGLLLAAVVVLELVHKERAFAAAALLASLGFAVSLGVLNVDGFIVRQNVGRAVHGESLDVPYLVSLSNDAVPALAEIFNTPTYSNITREAVGAALICREQLGSHGRTSDWRSFTLSQWMADSALAGLRPELDAYHFVDEAPASVITPGQAAQECVYESP